ncbi:hypothetical protein DPMN_086719 [Dreissena polymorpha]|uniref:Uncharacterized protein n=1 Tax=Dreissena polymorpha TaxID=45954 RepID=A0A9D4KRE8_DREPO|nr:hypothetical protein DPMN_086719 [Dreissena polymorpha]
MTLHPGDSCVNNWLLKAMAKDAGFLKHKRITNHSVRKFLVQKLRNANIPPTETMAITGHKNFFEKLRQTLGIGDPGLTVRVIHYKNVLETIAFNFFKMHKVESRASYNIYVVAALNT